jgi:hypothetical protein
MGIVDSIEGFGLSSVADSFVAGLIAGAALLLVDDV